MSDIQTKKPPIISVSRTYLPPIEEYVKEISRIWDSNILTNNGELVQELEGKLRDYWDVKNVVCVDHGTSALIIALKALGIKDEVWVSPFNFIADVSAPMWLGIKPHFYEYGKKVEGPAIITHLYGDANYWNYRQLPGPTIYDASHAFDLFIDGKSILSWGDVSVISFNAVKIFQTIEGGALVTNNNELAEKARWMRNFGFRGRYDFHGVGINCKMNEFQAAMGLCSLPLVPKIRERYIELIRRYNVLFNRQIAESVTYYPYHYKKELSLKKALLVFETNNIFPRRYFYPPLNRIFGGPELPMAEDISSRALALPLYYELTNAEQNLVIKIVKETDHA